MKNRQTSQDNSAATTRGIGILESFLAEQYVGGRDKVMYQNALRVYSPRK